MKKKMIYVVFSATPLKMGSMIRTVTREKYNHVAISFDPCLKNLYSYARYYKSTPFYGGFVKEKSSRYIHRNKIAEIYVCAVPITEGQCKLVKKRLFEMIKNHRQHRYNILSAAVAPFSKRVFVPGCFTCIEFVTHILSQIMPEISPYRFYSIEDLRRLLVDYGVYKGPFPNINNHIIDENYERRIGIVKNLKLSATSEIGLIGTFFNKNRARKGK